MNDNLRNLLAVLLNCGYADLTTLEDCQYDFGDLVENCQFNFGKVELNALVRTMFDLGIQEIVDIIKERKQDTEDEEERAALDKLDPYEDIQSFHNYLDKNNNIYKKYLSDALDTFEEKTGFSISNDIVENVNKKLSKINEDVASEVFNLIKDMDWRDYYDSRFEGERDFRAQIKNHPETVISMLKEVDNDSPYYDKAQELILKITNKDRKINEEFNDKFYLKLLRAIDNDANTLRNLYEEGDKAPVTILHNMDYYEDKNNDYKLVNTSEVDGRKYSQVFDFTPFETSEAYVEYYVLVDDKIPEGFTKTKLMFDFEIN